MGSASPLAAGDTEPALNDIETAIWSSQSRQETRSDSHTQTQGWPARADAKSRYFAKMLSIAASIPLRPRAGSATSSPSA